MLDLIKCKHSALTGSHQILSFQWCPTAEKQTSNARSGADHTYASTETRSQCTEPVLRDNSNADAQPCYVQTLFVKTWHTMAGCPWISLQQ